MCVCVSIIPYSGKLSWISRFECHLQKFSPRNVGRAAPTCDWFQAICESFLCEILTSYGSAKVFSLESLPLYGIYPPPPMYINS